MPELAHAAVNLFYGSWQSVPAKTQTLFQALEAIRTGQYRDKIRVLRAVLAHEGKRAYDRAKAKLDAYTFGGTFAPRRGNANLVQHSGLICGDLDHVVDVEALKQAIASDRHTVYAFISPSSTGLKVGVHAPLVADDAAYKHAWSHVAAAYQHAYGAPWDRSGKDIARLTFVSHDPTAYVNLDAEVFPVSPLPPPTPRAPHRSVSRSGTSYQGYAERAIHTAVHMIETAELGTRHYTRLKAARLLGGYVAGGLMSEDQAYGALAQALVGHTDDLERALKTVEDGLAYGNAHPITLEELEAERRGWLAHRYRDNSLQGERRPLLGARYLAREMTR
jgi:VirE N-terminal domain